MGPIRASLHATSSCHGLTSSAKHAICSGRACRSQSRSAGVQCQAKTKAEAESGRIASIQSLLSRLASDASALANIVPLRIDRLRSDSNEAQSATEAPATQDTTRDTSASVDDHELESQLEEQLKAQGHQAGFLDTLRQWRDTRRRRPDPDTDQEVHPALDLLQQRIQSGSRPGARTDSFKLGLAVEGGGMRGCVTAGALRALHACGARDAFDAVYGSSAGAMNLTYYLSEQPEGVDIYHEDIANERFCNMRRLLNRNEGPALDLSFLLLEVMCSVKPLNWQRVIDSPIPLKVVASCLDTLQPVILEDFESTEDLQECLRASAQVPAVAGDPIMHRGRRLVDAAVFEPVPFRAAISDGCTHVITLCSRPPINGGWVSQMKEDMLSNLVKRAVLSPTYMKAAWARELDNLRHFGLTTDQMMMASLDPTSNKLGFLAGSYNYPIIPGADSRISPVSIDPPTIKAGIAAGEAAVRDLLGEQIQSPHYATEQNPYFSAAIEDANGMEPYVPTIH